MARVHGRFPTHGPDLRALLASCHADPDDDTARLVLADWLQEHDDPRGEVMRLQSQIAALPAGAPEYDVLFDRHQKWWKKYGGLWKKEVGDVMWDRGPHDRGLPVIGYHGGEDDWLHTSTLQGQTTAGGYPLPVVITTGWSGMTWVLVEDPLASESDLDFSAADRAKAIVDVSFEPFERAPWAGSPTPIGIGFPWGVVVTPRIINRVAKIPNLRGFSFGDAEPAPDLLPRIGKLTHLEHLDLGGTPLDDDGVKSLAPLKRLRTLIATEATITDTGATGLAKFTELRELQLGSRHLTAAGYQSLAKLSMLEVLALKKADNTAIQHLSALTRIRKLDLRGTKITGRGIENFPLLTHLNLGSTRASDAGLANLAALTRLRHLNLGETRITGATLAHLPGLRWLEDVWAFDTAADNKSLVHLERLKNLNTVYLMRTRVTKTGIAGLRKKLRKMNVH